MNIELTLTASAKQQQVNSPITDRVKTYEDACAVLGIDKTTAGLSLPGELKQYATSFIAFIKLSIIASALNEGWVPDWDNDNQRKYYVWMEKKKSGFSFRYVDDYYRFSYVGSRLCFRSREIAEYAGRQFQKEYNELFV